MAEEIFNQPLNSAEENNETSWYKALGAGLASGIIKIPEGIVSLGAELIDLGADSDTAGDVEEFFDKINIFEETAEERTIGKLTQAITQIAVPGGIGFKVANKAARKLTTKALKAKRENFYTNFGKGKKYYEANSPGSKLSKRQLKKIKPLETYDPNKLKRGLNKVIKLNKIYKYPRFAMAVTGGAVGEGLVIDTEEIGTFGDMFEGPTMLNRDENLSGREDATRKLMNRFKFGTESLLVTPLAFGVGSTVKSLSKRGKELAYSNSKFERFINKYIRVPLIPEGDMPNAIFKSGVTKSGLKSRDTHRAQQLVSNITKVVDGIFPVAQEVADKSVKAEKSKFMKDINEVLLGGDLDKGLDIKKLKELLDNLSVSKNINKDQQNLLSGSLIAARGELNNLVTILQKNSKGFNDSAKQELKDLFSKRLEGYIGSTYEIFNTKSSIFNFFKTYQPTDEVIKNVTKVFTSGGRTEQQARSIVDEILAKAQDMKKPSQLDNIKYTNKTMQNGKLNIKEMKIGISEGAPGTASEKKALKELFGETKDPRFTLFNGMTNLSSLARTSAYLTQILERNTEIQAKGGRGFFWTDKAKGLEAVNAKNTKIELVDMKEVLGKIDATENIINPFTSKETYYTTKEIGEAIRAANDVTGALQGFVRGKDTKGAEKVASWFYRNLLLFPKGVSQMAKTIFSIPTHLRNFFSAGAFTAANGILFEGLSNPGLLKKAFQEGIDVSGLLKAGQNSSRAQAAYQEMLELGLTNTQVQIGDMAALFKATDSGGNMLGDGPLVRMFKKFKDFAQGKYMAEDDTFKITNYTVELDRIIRSGAKRAHINSLNKLKTASKEGDKTATKKLIELEKRGVSLEDFKKELGLGSKEILDGNGIPVRNKALWELKKQAAEIVQNTVPNYAFVGEAVKTARLLPIGNFMSFPSEIIRTSTGIAQQGVKEMRHSVKTIGSNMGLTVIEAANPGVRVANDAITNGTYGTGFKRLLGMATTLTGIPIAVTEGAMALYDVTEEEIDAMRRFVPEWSKNSTLVPVRDDDGELRYIDFSHSNAYDLMARPFRTIMNGIQEGEQDGDTLLEGFVNGTMEASGELMNPFISESIWTEAMFDLYIRGGRTAEGKQLYTDQTSLGDKMAIQFMHLGKALAPSYKQFQRLGQASFGTPDKTGEILDIGPELAGFMGLRPIKIDPLRTMTFKIAGYQRGIRNARREFTGGFFGLLKGGSIDPQDIVERYIASNKARFDVQKDMFKNLEAAGILGESTAELQDVFKERQISNATFQSLNDGRFDPYFPSTDILNKFREISAGLDESDPFIEVGDEVRELQNSLRKLKLNQRFAIGGRSVQSQPGINVLESVLPMLVKIRDDMENLELDDEFNIKLTDYVAVDEEIITPPLPQTPMPIINQPQPAMPANVAQNTQGKDPITNLTRTEEALLSPMEKVIASRT
jgi:hypothetical protein